MASLHRRAARWYERNGQLTDAVRHAAEAGDWQLAASIVIDGLAIGEIIEPRGSPSLADEFRTCRTARPGPNPSRTWSPPRSRCPLAGMNPAPPRWMPLTASSASSRRSGGRVPAGRRDDPPRRCPPHRGLHAAAAAAAGAEVLVSAVPGGKLARHREIRARVLSGRGAVELWSGHLDAGGPYPGFGRGRRDRFGRGGRTSRLPWAPRAGGGLARPAEPRGHSWPPRRPRPARPTSRGRPSRTPAPRRLSHWPGCTWNTMSCARRTAGSSRRTPPSA